MPKSGRLELERAPAPSGCRGEHRSVVGEQRRWEPVGRCGFVEARDDVGSLEDRQSLRSDEQTGVVVDHVEDLDLGPGGEAPVGDVGLPPLVGLVGLEPHERAARTFLRLGDDEPTPA